MTEMVPEPEGSLISYRLGRVEKLMESYKQDSEARDDRVITKLDQFLEQFNSQYVPEVSNLKYRVGELEKFKKVTLSALGAISLLMIGLILNLIVRLIP